MENRPLSQSFTHSLLDSYDMQEDEVHQTQAPLSQSPEPYVSKDLLKSATIENLISQNEELMTRQRVTLRRLATLEDLNQELQNENFQAKNQILNYSDQVQVFKEKDNAWKAKVDELESEKEKLAHIAKEFQSIQSEIERHRKYHDKVKYQVKPYIQSLKISRDQAQKDLDSLRNQIHMKDTQVKEMREHMKEILRQAKNQVDDMHRQKQGLLEHFENQIQSLKEEKSHFEASFNEMKLRVNQMDIAIEKKAELENRVIELERSKQQLKLDIKIESTRQQSRIDELENLKVRYEIENEDLKLHIQNDHAMRLKLEEDILQVRRQMENLRFMWNQKHEESERQKKSLEALENLNNSLSQKIEELRTQSSGADSHLPKFPNSES
jgi:chromosome segregation ATPase